MLDLEVATHLPQRSASLAPTVRGSVSGVRAPQNVGLTGRVVSVAPDNNDKAIMIMALVAVAMTVVTGLTASFLRASAQGAANKLTAEVAALTSQFKTGPVAEAYQREQTVEKQLATLTGFLADAVAWPTVLDSLSGLVPSGAKLTTINIGADKAVRITGESSKQEDAATFMAAIDASTLFDTPRLDSLSLSESVDGSVVLFSIATRYTPSQPKPLITPASLINPVGGASSGPDFEASALDHSPDSLESAQ